jgi:lysophospholipase L1-like esterase
VFRIVVVGDSVLRGDHRYGFTPHNMAFWLTEMIDKEILPGQVEVFNMAAGARTITRDSPNSFKKDLNYDHVKHSDPDAIIMMFGSNDCYKSVWKGRHVFVEDYEKFVNKMISLVGGDKNKFFMLTPPPLHPKEGKMNFDRGEGACEADIRNDVYPKLFPQMKTDLEIPDTHYIDAFNLLGGKDLSKQELFCQMWKGKEECDRSHPSE